MLLGKRAPLILFSMLFCSLIIPDVYASSDAATHLNLPIGWVTPFVGLLLTMGVMSFMATNYPHGFIGRLWESNFNKLIIAILWSIPVIYLFYSLNEWNPVIHSLIEYVAFISLLFALFVISGGIYLEGDLRATPTTNTAFLAIGAVLANFIGTTGASVLLIRPLLRTNRERLHTSHIPIFFIFIVSNIGGCLLPIGDPPLFLGYLKGVPFFWTLKLWAEWLTAIGMLLAIFFVWDTLSYRKESATSLAFDENMRQPLNMKGRLNIVWLTIVLAAVVLITPEQLKQWGMATGAGQFLREYVLLGMALISLLSSPLNAEARQKNHFSFGPIIEVAALFIGIFIAMIPALEYLNTHGNAFGLTQAWQYFWTTGALSAVLDNAPTYLTFLSVAQGVVTDNPSAYVVPENLSHLQVTSEFLIAISLGAVFMGAGTYIGNGPNFMVKSIAEEWGYKMPDFFTYMLYSFGILIPIFLIITFLFLP
jgi:Na+/H+ antiporter NhaD/arsenite permease-like protein